MVNYSEAIKRSFSDWKKFAIGTVLYLIPFLNLITGMFGTGYSLLCAKTAMKKNYKLPEWENWGDLFIKGLLAYVIMFLWFIPTFILAAIAGGAALLAFFQGDQTAAIGAFGGLGIVAGLVFLITIYLMPSILLQFADKGKFGAGFDFGNIFSMAFTGDYFVAWILTMVIGIVAVIIMGLISMLLAITVVLPWIVSAMFSFWMAVTSMTIFGEVYGSMK